MSYIQLTIMAFIVQMLLSHRHVVQYSYIITVCVCVCVVHSTGDGAGVGKGRTIAGDNT